MGEGGIGINPSKLRPYLKDVEIRIGGALLVLSPVL